MTTAYLTRSKATLLVDNDVDGGHGPAATATIGRNNSSSSMNKQTSVGQSQPQMISLRRSNSSPETDRRSTIYNNKSQSNSNSNSNNNNVNIQDLINAAIDATTNNPTLHIPVKLRSCLSGSRLNEMYGSSSSSSAAATAANQSSQRPMKRNVSFGHIHIREHPIVLGDNPAVSTGPALSLGWFDGGHDDGDCHENDDDGNNRTNKSSSSLEFQIPVDEYEKERQHGGSAPRRSATHQLVLSREERQRILQTEAGVTMNDIRKIETEINKIKRSRRKTNEQSSKQQRRRKSTGCGGGGGGSGSGCAASVVGNSIVSTFDGVWKKITSGTASSGAGTTSSQRELDELMYRSALAEKVRREQELQELQRHLQKQPCKFKAYGGTDAPPTVPKRGGRRRPQLVVGGDDSFSSRADSDEDDQSSCRDRRYTVPLSTLSHSSSEPFLVLLNSTTSCSNESNELVDGAVSSDSTEKKALGGSGKKAADDDGDDDGTDSTSESDSEEEEDDDDDDDNDDDDCDYYVEDDLAKDLAAIIASRATPNDRKGKSEATVSTVIADASTSDNDDDDDDDEPFMF